MKLFFNSSLLNSRFKSLIFVTALVILSTNAQVFAQETKPVDKPDVDVGKIAESTYRLTYTITESDGSKPIGVQRFSLTLNSGQKYSELKSGSKVPVLTTTNKATSTAYMDTGLIIKANLTNHQNGKLLDTQIELSMIDTIKAHPPLFGLRSAILKNTTLLTIGKPVLIGSWDTLGNTVHQNIEVEVLLEPVY